MSERKVGFAIDMLRAYEPPEGYWLAFSGGKDSQAIYHLAVEAGVRFEPHYNITSADPPELVRFIKQQYPSVARDMPALSMWRLIPSERRPFTRLARYCCRLLKERGGEGRFVITGVRWAESASRRNRRGLAEVHGEKETPVVMLADNEETRHLMENCPAGNGRRILNPIIDWTDRDVWTFIRSRNLPYCSLYDEGFKRLGCIACPQGGSRQQHRDLRRWPKYRAMYVQAFDAMLVERAKREMPTTWKSGEEVLRWWIGPEAEYPLWDGGRVPYRGRE